MAKYLIIFLLLHPSLCANKSWLSLVVFWNVGQGQWITAITPDQCLHFDFGGELSYWTKNKNLFLKLCKEKQNVLHLSHPDLDHYSFYPLMTKSVSKICWQEIDHTKIPTKRLTRKIPLCLDQLKRESLLIYKPSRYTNKNDSSKVYRYKTVLVPGDSSLKQEKIWSKLIDHPRKINILALGHHGSRTSSSEYLLAKLANLKMAFVQSRKNKFGHPHKETTEKLKKHRIPLVTTEDWGTTAILL